MCRSTQLMNIPMFEAITISCFSVTNNKNIAILLDHVDHENEKNDNMYFYSNMYISGMPLSIIPIFYHCKGKFIPTYKLTIFVQDCSCS